MNWQDVESSNIAAIGYDAATRTLGVRFKNGGTYHCLGVEPKDHEAFLAAGDAGLADFEGQAVTGIDGSSYRPRRVELALDNLLDQRGTRRMPARPLINARQVREEGAVTSALANWIIRGETKVSALEVKR